jgi:hypothetical protein
MHSTDLQLGSCLLFSSLSNTLTQLTSTLILVSLAMLISFNESLTFASYHAYFYMNDCLGFKDRSSSLECYHMMAYQQCLQSHPLLVNE